MSLLPDPAELLSIADRIADHAAAARSRAIELGTAIAAAGWHGAAADAFGATAQVVLAGLRAAGSRLDDAADALRRSAAIVQVLLDELERLAGRLLELGGDVGTIVEDGLFHPTRVLTDGGDLLGDAAGLVGDVGHLLGID